MTSEAPSPPVCVITGAGAGLGLATARRFAADGHAVVIVDRDGDRAEKAAAAIVEKGQAARPYRLDVSREPEVEAFAGTMRTEYGHVDVLVNNAGVALREGNVVDMTRKAWDLTLAVNLTGPFLVSRHLVPLMPRGGAIINISTVGAVRAVPDTDAYVASKSGLIGLTKAMALSLADREIRVNVVCPGTFATDEVRSRFDDPRVQAMMARTMPVGRDIGDPDELAAVVHFLGVADSSYINGAVLNVDGGALC